MTIREGKWDCPYCDKKGNRGRDISCTGCGKKRADDIKFYLDESADAAPEVVDEKQLAQANAGADWICEFCKASNPNLLKACKTCGADRTEVHRKTEVIIFVWDCPKCQHKKIKATEFVCPNCKADQPDDVKTYQDHSPPEPEKPPEPPKKKWFGLFGLFLMAFAASMASPLLTACSSEKEASVQKVSWVRTVEIEQLSTVRHEGWESALPFRARVVSSSQRQFDTKKIQTGTKTESHDVTEKVQTGTKKVKVGVKDLGNGHFEDQYAEKPIYADKTRTVSTQVPVYRDEPVMKTWVVFEVEEWNRARTARAEGTEKNPKWPSYQLASREREGAKREQYQVHFLDSTGKDRVFETDEARWRTFEVGNKHQLTVGMLGGVKDVN